MYVLRDCMDLNYCQKGLCSTEDVFTVSLTHYEPLQNQHAWET